MALTRQVWKRLAIVVAVAALGSPGWEASLAPADHDAILESAAVSGAPFGVVAVSGGDGEWHAQYHGSRLARALGACGLRAAVPSLVPPHFAAHVPSARGLLRPADGYYAVAAKLRWPWWRPGGGVRWERP